MLLPILLAGGVGDRLWPLSKASYPKQFLSLNADQASLFQQTIKRLPDDPSVAAPYVVCHEDHRFIVEEQLGQKAERATILLESSRNNTAPALAIAAHLANQREDNPILCVLPTDHQIDQVCLFQEKLLEAYLAAQDNHLITFGIIASTANTGYGYIKPGIPLSNHPNFHHVEHFYEKPQPELAKQYLQSGYLWNSGMFLFSCNTFLEELKHHEPRIYQLTEQAIQYHHIDHHFIRPEKNFYQQCPKRSIDHAIMEKTNKAVTTQLPVNWSDLGSFQGLWDIGQKDTQGNIKQGAVVNQDSTNCYIHSSKRLVTTLGIDNLAVVETNDALLVASLDKAQQVKSLVDDLHTKGFQQAHSHNTVHRPWGNFESLITAPGFQVKKITVSPGRSLSLQLHHHRSEHWIVVKGTAHVQRGDEKLILTENQSTYIPINTKHQLHNRQQDPLEIIEVQCGDYLGEDDIVRFADNYGRVTEHETNA